ncbi:MAG TPA: enhanced serine sensitivity protein SseB C-terminal domain-containing protein [Peptococcaceae bacterium]|nr:enhanced serine sensitivity protein SseB C-terminal domain-containing protein [Peptococcaceae bacterium]
MIFNENRPVSNPRLVDIMNKFILEKTKQNEILLINEIIQAEFLVPVILEGKIENGVLCPGSTLHFKTLINDRNEAFFIAFTDWDELRKWSKQSEQTVIAGYDDLKGLVFQEGDEISGFAINPYGQNFVLTPEIMQCFSKVRAELFAQHDRKILLTPPDGCPEAMLNALRKFFRKKKGVQKAFLFAAQREGDPKPYYLLIIDYAGEVALLLPSITALTRKFLGEEEILELLPLNSSFGQKAAAGASPFYQRKWWQFF